MDRCIQPALHLRDVDFYRILGDKLPFCGVIHREVGGSCRLRSRNRPAPESFPRRRQIPVPYPADYYTLIETARKSKYEPIYLSNPCPKEDCSCKLLRLRCWFVERHTVLFDPNGVALHRESPVPLALCEQCKSRFRVLPVEILPYKTFGLPVIEAACLDYATSTDGLRKTVRTIPGVAPHYSTLHGWMGGLGERAMDKVHLERDRATIGRPSLPPTSTLVAETAKRQDLGLINRWNKTKPPIAPGKYKSLFRKELLRSCLRLLSIAASLFEHDPYPLTLWQHWLLPMFFVAAWLFPSRNIITPIQRTVVTDNMLTLVPKNTTPRAPP